VPSLNYNLTFLSDDFGAFKGKEKELDFSLDAAYYYNFVFQNKFTIAPYAYVGRGIRFINYRQKGAEMNSEEKNRYFTYEYGVGLHLGYNSEKFLFGGGLNLSSFNYQQDKDNQFKNNSL